MFRGAELTRLLTSLLMLAVLGMLIVQSQDAGNWQWLCGQQASGDPIDPANSIHGRPADEAGNSNATGPSLKKTPQAGTTKQPSSKQNTSKQPSSPAGVSSAASPKADRASTAPPRAHGKALDLPPPPSGPTDLDEEERDAAIEEFQALTDRTLEMHPEEMNAYWRLFSWMQNQSPAGLRKRAIKDVVMNDFIQSADDFRGKLVALDLNVRRVLRYPAPKNRLGIKNVYEVTGFTTESQAWLYIGLTADLPKGMPIGSSVEERATFYGYFLKLQGYYRAGAKPDERPLAAPLLIGRMVWHSAAAAQAQGESFSQVFWVAISGAVLAVVGGVWLIVRFIGGPPAAVPGGTLRPLPEVPIDQWLRTAGEHRLEIGGADPGRAESDAAEGDGQSDRPLGGRLGGIGSVGHPDDWFGGNGSSNGRHEE